jgi:hypothetical protein
MSEGRCSSAATVTLGSLALMFQNKTLSIGNPQAQNLASAALMFSIVSAPQAAPVIERPVA